jgi:hypothetical protein
VTPACVLLLLLAFVLLLLDEKTVFEGLVVVGAALEGVACVGGATPRACSSGSVDMNEHISVSRDNTANNMEDTGVSHTLGGCAFCCSG